MNLRTILIALAMLALAAFALLNWSAITNPTTLSVGFAEVQAPLGVVLLVFAAALSALFLAYIVFQQAGVIMEARRYAKELKSHRELADTAEASRFTDLRAFLETKLSRLEAQGNASTRQLEDRLSQLEARLRSTGSLPVAPVTQVPQVPQLPPSS